MGQMSREDMTAFEKDAKLGLLATVNPQGLPHLSLITSIQAKSPDRLMFGQFCEGLSKKHVKENPHTAFLVMSPDKELWRGRARWTGDATSGEDYEMYNRKPMFRYNSYFGIHTVHYLEIVEFVPKESVSVWRLAVDSLLTKLACLVAGAEPPEAILKPWAQNLLAEFGALKFLSYVREDGYPEILPVVPCQSAGSGRLVFAPALPRSDLGEIPVGATVAVLALNLQMESVLVRGCFTGYRHYAVVKAGTIDIDWVYNSMPPMQGPIYPVQPVVPVADHHRSA